MTFQQKYFSTSIQFIFLTENIINARSIFKLSSFLTNYEEVLYLIFNFILRPEEFMMIMKLYLRGEIFIVLGMWIMLRCLLYLVMKYPVKETQHMFLLNLQHFL